MSDGGKRQPPCVMCATLRREFERLRPSASLRQLTLLPLGAWSLFGRPIDDEDTVTEGQPECIQARSLYGRGNCATAGDFGADPRCSRLRVRHAVSSAARQVAYQSQFNDLTKNILPPKS